MLVQSVKKVKERFFTMHRKAVWHVSLEKFRTCFKELGRLVWDTHYDGDMVYVIVKDGPRIPGHPIEDATKLLGEAPSIA